MPWILGLVVLGGIALAMSNRPRRTVRRYGDVVISHPEVAPDMMERGRVAWERLTTQGTDSLHPEHWEDLANLADALGDSEAASSYRLRGERMLDEGWTAPVYM